jgi:tripartite-type tricarboxylate transporter receptor subunit TctC
LSEISSRARARSCSGVCAAALGLVAAASLVVTPPAAAQDVAGFYAGQTVRMIIGYPTGGSNDIYARLVAQHIGRHIPGAPRVIAVNMPGAGSMLAANHLYAVAPRDGSVIASVSQGIPLQGKLNYPEARYEAGKFNWLGRMAQSTSVTMVWHTAKAKNFDDALRSEITLSATGAGSTVTIYPNVMNELLKTRFKLIMGYKGSGEGMLAMQRGEVEGHSTTWEAVKAVHPDWLPQGQIRVLVQHAIHRHSELPDVPTSVELARDPEARAVMRVIMGANEVGKSYFTAPGVPAERVAALRRAFDATMKDVAFVEAVKKIRGEVGALTGEEVQALIGELDTLPQSLFDRVKSIYNER